jgi:hypothetical protein
MPALTISAVDNTTDQITITAHGLNTGDGPAAIFAASASGVLPAPLAAVTDYWIIKVDANTIKLATSAANANGNVPINITTNGTLPLSLLVGLPYRRARTYTAGSQVFSADLDSMQDDLIALWNLLSGQAQSIWSQVNLAVPLKHGLRTLVLPVSIGTTPQNGQNFTNLAAGSVVGSGGPLLWVMPIPLDVGKRILAVRARIVDSTGPTTIRMALKNTAGTVVATVTSLGNGTQQDLALNGLTATVADDHVHGYYLNFDSTAGTLVTSILDVAVDYDAPA